MSVLVSTLQGHNNNIYMGIPYECPSVNLEGHRENIYIGIPYKCPSVILAGSQEQ